MKNILVTIMLSIVLIGCTCDNPFTHKIVEKDRGILLYKRYDGQYTSDLGEGHVRLIHNDSVVDLKINSDLLKYVDTIKNNDTIFVYKWSDGEYSWTTIRK